MSERLRKISKHKKPKTGLPKHVQSSAEQLGKMEAAVRNLLAPMVDRLHVFVHPEAYKKSSKKKRKK